MLLIEGETEMRYGKVTLSVVVATTLLLLGGQVFSSDSGSAQLVHMNKKNVITQHFIVICSGGVCEKIDLPH